jgi:small-conductance mechanosensitive channel
MTTWLFHSGLWTSLANLVLAVILGVVATLVFFAVVRRIAARADSDLGRWLAQQLRRPSLLLVPALAAKMTLPLARLPDAVAGPLHHGLWIVLIAGIAWTLISLTAVIDDFLGERFVLSKRDNLEARRIHTRFRVLRRILVIVVLFLAVASVLLTFDSVRQIGAGLLASAGVAGIVIGLAMRPTVETLLAGLQLALTEPINLDDVVIVEGEWGRIEEITATYVVVHIWDDRRLIVPVRTFLDQAFQNWTRVRADLLGQVNVHVDYRTPVEPVRQAVGEIVAGSKLWDRRFWNLQVVDADARSMQLRVLVSASDSSNAWDLRCEVREKLIAHLQEHHPESLPRLRAVLEAGPAAAGGPPAP